MGERLRKIQSARKGVKMKIVLTGKMTQTRDQMWEKFNKQSIKVMKAVTSTTDYLVTGNMMGVTSKYEDAKAKGTIILTEQEFYVMIEKDYPEYML